MAAVFALFVPLTPHFKNKAENVHTLKMKQKMFFIYFMYI